MQVDMVAWSLLPKDRHSISPVKRAEAPRASKVCRDNQASTFPFHSPSRSVFPFENVTSNPTRIMADATATTTPLRVGIMGTANIARKNIAAIRVASGVEVVAVGSRSAARATTYAEENDLDPATCACYGSYQELLDSPDVDAVYIPLPTALHAEWAPKAALAGKHVLCEKPLARDAAELQTILASFDENSGLVFMDGVMFMVRDAVCGSRRVAWCVAVAVACHRGSFCFRR